MGAYGAGDFASNVLVAARGRVGGWRSMFAGYVVLGGGLALASVAIMAGAALGPWLFRACGATGTVLACGTVIAAVGTAGALARDPAVALKAARPAQPGVHAVSLKRELSTRSMAPGSFG